MLNLKMKCRNCSNILTVEDGHSDGSCHFAGLSTVCNSCFEVYNHHEIEYAVKEAECTHLQIINSELLMALETLTYYAGTTAHNNPSLTDVISEARKTIAHAKEAK